MNPRYFSILNKAGVKDLAGVGSFYKPYFNLVNGFYADFST